MGGGDTVYVGRRVCRFEQDVDERKNEKGRILELGCNEEKAQDLPLESESDLFGLPRSRTCESVAFGCVPKTRSLSWKTRTKEWFRPGHLQ